MTNVSIRWLSLRRAKQPKIDALVSAKSRPGHQFGRERQRAGSEALSELGRDSPEAIDALVLPSAAGPFQTPPGRDIDVSSRTIARKCLILVPAMSRELRR